MIRSTGTSGLSNMKLNKTSISIDNEKISNSKNNIKTDNIIDMGIQYGCGSAMYGCGAVIRPTMTTEQLNEAFNESLRKQRAEEMRREVERINSEEEEEVSFFGCVLDTLTGYGEDISDAYDATKSFVSDAASTVGDFYDYTIDYTSDKMVEIEEKVNNAVDTVKDVYDYTIDYTSDKIGEISDAVTKKINYVENKIENLFLDGVEGISKIFATIGNVSLSFTKGALSLVEGLGDTAILAAGGIGSIYTLAYDFGTYLGTGEFGNTTEKWINAYTGKIAYSWVDDIDETLELREGLDEYSYDLFDSDGTGSMVAEGVGETVGILAMVMSTGGAGAVTLTTSTTVSVPTALAVVSGTSGIGTHTEEGFNEIINQNQQQEAYKRLENVEVTQEMYEEKLKEMKAREDKEYTNEEVLNEIYSDLYIEELNKVKASGEYNSLNGTDVSKGVAYGVGNAGIDAAQWYAGGKINTISPFNGKAANILTRVGLDTADAMVEVPAREATKMLYREDIEGNKMSFSEIWKEDGATRQLGVQAVLGGGGSLIGETAGVLKGKLKKSNVSSIEFDKSNLKNNELHSNVDLEKELAFFGNESMPRKSFSKKNLIHSELTHNQKFLVDSVNNILKTGKNAQFRVNSTSELSSNMLSKMDDLSRVKIELIDGLGSDYQLKPKYEHTRYYERITYTGYEMNEIVKKLEYLQSFVDTDLPVAQRARQVRDILASEVPVMHDYDKYKYGHHVSASLRGLTDYNLVGKPGLVCAGYASAYKELCDRVGIPCEYIRGVAYMDPLRQGTAGGHAWNLVHTPQGDIPVDVTWYASSGGKKDWFGSSDEFIGKHVADPDEIYRDYSNALPESHFSYFPTDAQVDFVKRTCDQKYGYGTGTQALIKYCQTGSIDYITRTNDARVIIESLGIENVKKCLINWGYNI